jgi:hypothetical protein
MLLVVVLLFATPLLILAMLRHRISGSDNQVDQVGLDEFDDLDHGNRHLARVHHQTRQPNHGKFIGFSIFLVGFFTLLSAIVSYNIFGLENLFLFQVQKRDTLLSSVASVECSMTNGKELLGAYGGDVADYHLRISTSSSWTQKLFDQGLSHLFGFNQIEAKRNFEAAIQEDENCVLCLWGIAATQSVNLNDEVMTSEEYRVGFVSIEMAALRLLERGGHQSDDQSCPKEDLLIHSMRERLALSPADWNASPPLAVRDEMERAYSHALGVALEMCPDDEDFITLFAESILNLSPWSYFRSGVGQFRTRSDLTEDAHLAFTLLHRLLFNSSGMTTTKTNLSSVELFSPLTPRHPLALHLYLHLAEQFSSPTPSSSAPTASHLLTAADTLLSQSLSPPLPLSPRHTLNSSPSTTLIHSVGHLLHMPSHAYYRTGLFDTCLLASQVAISTDSFYQKHCFQPYLPSHNVAMFIVCAMESGQMNIALTASPYHSSLLIPLIEATRFMTSMVPWPQVWNTQPVCLSVSTQLLRTSSPRDSVAGSWCDLFTIALQQTLQPLC